MKGSFLTFDNAIVNIEDKYVPIVVVLRHSPFAVPFDERTVRLALSLVDRPILDTDDLNCKVMIEK